MENSGPVKRRACTNCTAAKARCNSRSDNMCERCSRLGKPCVFLDMPSRKRRQGPSRHVEVLESKLDHLAAQLSDLARQKSPLPTVPTKPSTSSSRHGTWSSVNTSSSAPSSSISPASGIVATPGNIADDASTIDVVEGGIVSLRDAEERLEEFRTHYTPYCPFVAVHPAYTIEIVRRELPMTFLAVMAVTESHRPSIRAVLREKLRRLLYIKAALNGEASPDLLRGLLIYGAWHHYFFERRKPQVFLLLQLCLTLVHELGLERKIPSRLEGKVAAAELEFNHTHSVSDVKGGSDSKRLLLGVYWFSVAGSKGLRKSCSMQFTNFMVDCTRELTDQGEYITDKFIGRMIRFQTLTSRVAEVFNYYDSSMISIQGDAAVQHATDSFLHELKSIENVFPRAMAETAVEYSSMEAYSLQSWVYEVAFHNQSWGGVTVQDQDARRSPGGMTGASLLRYNMLWRLLDINKRVIDGFLALSGQEAKVTFALLDAFDSGNGDMIHDGEGHSSMDKLIVDKVGYIGSCTSLMEKFDAVLPGSLQMNGDIDAMQQFSNLTKSMMLGYSKQLQDRLESRDVRLGRADSDISRQQADPAVHPAVSVNDNPPREDMEPAQGSTDDMETADWANFDVTSMEGFFGFDEKAWETMMNEFTLPP